MTALETVKGLLQGQACDCMQAIYRRGPATPCSHCEDKITPSLELKGQVLGKLRCAG